MPRFRPPAARPVPVGVVAVGLMVLSSLLYVVGYSLTRILVVEHGLAPLQVTFLRCVLVLAAAGLAMAWPRAGITPDRLLRPRRAWVQRGAAAALVISNVMGIVAYSLMPVTLASALGFLTPLLVAGLAGWLLRESVGARRWLGVGLAFVGMLLIVRPGAAPPLTGLLASITAALAYAVYQIQMRTLRDVATSLDGALQVALVGTLALAVPAWIGWHPVSALAWGLVGAFVVVQTAALVCLNAALHRGEASRLAPWQFSGLVWGMAFDLGLFGLLPGPLSLLGGVLIGAGGVLAQTRPGKRRGGGRERKGHPALVGGPGPQTPGRGSGLPRTPCEESGGRTGLE
ncbi:DMT family transporter [Pararhodospirillum oryzae]|uniref:EamA domain-containing protein n=1 Tax=Pararhodospirillum oryzae TaxID=478448 RepID=A0A512H4J8_9PROT|nr:DMT family transporter [Pararhodospirillum oryzae]GEO80361.1 hypothetical protein ROR02_04920 [Pararhodospirillum oryzae]